MSSSQGRKLTTTLSKFGLASVPVMVTPRAASWSISFCEFATGSCRLNRFAVFCPITVAVRKVPVTFFPADTVTSLMLLAASCAL